MKILIVAEEEWNDNLYRNGVLTNWFSGFDAEFAQIYCSPGFPCNGICKKYFRITDAEMVKSLLGYKLAGKTIYDTNWSNVENLDEINIQRQGIYKIFKRLSLYVHTIIMILKDLIWIFGKYDKRQLDKFIKDFNPDIIFCPRLATPKLLRLERIIHGMSNAPMIAFTGDDEASFNQYSWSPLYWIRRWYCNRLLKKNICNYSYYLMHSKQQAKYYKEIYNITTSTLFKCGDFKNNVNSKKANNPIRMIYAGRLYCNRWKTLSVLGDAMKIINYDSEKIILEIYTQDKLSTKQLSALSESKSIYLKGNISANELSRIYQKADIALHVESFDKKFRYATMVSFSTKIIDLMASSCAILAICWEQQCGLTYLSENNAAFCVTSYDKIYPMLKMICDNPKIIKDYASKAWSCGSINHSQKQVQDNLNNLFHELIIK